MDETNDLERFRASWERSTNDDSFDAVDLWRLWGGWATKVNVKGQRRGQWAMNTLSIAVPDLANAITGSSDDPFYNDVNLSAFFERVEAEWLNYFRSPLNRNLIGGS